MKHYPHFYDSAAPENIPSGVMAAVYINQAYRWDKRDVDRMSRIFCVSVLGDPKWAALARCIDVEQGAAVPQNVPPFIAERRKHYNDATAYVNRSNWQQIVDLVDRDDMEQPYYWVATLDGTLVPDPLPVDKHGRTIYPWAVQYKGTRAYDLSILYGRRNLHRI